MNIKKYMMLIPLFFVILMLLLMAEIEITMDNDDSIDDVILQYGIDSPEHLEYQARIVTPLTPMACIFISLFLVCALAILFSGVLFG